MAKNISLYPMLTKKRAREIFTIPIPTLRYTRSGQKWQLTLDDPESSNTSISDDNGYWNPDEYDLYFEWLITYKNACWLYNSELWEYACACSSAIIGVALSWYSSDSKRRYTKPIDILINDNALHSIKCEEHFNIAELRGEVGFSIILYIKEAGSPKEDELHLANTPGTVLGEIDSITLSLDGNGSYFTIYEVSRPGQPLWDVEYIMDDPSTDLFSECVSICLNKAHKKFPLVQRGNGLFCQQMLNEIMANAMAIVIEMVRSHEKDDNFDCLSNVEEGSVAQALLYFKDKLLWDFSTPITVSHSARLYIEKNIKDYENNRI